jgi:hypothetical protein
MATLPFGERQLRAGWKDCDQARNQCCKKRLSVWSQERRARYSAADHGSPG